MGEMDILCKLMFWILSCCFGGGEMGLRLALNSQVTATRGCIALEFSINIKVKLIALNKNDNITMT